MATSLASVDAYIAAQAPEARARLNELRSAVRGAVPDAVESISYGMPTYKRDGRPVAYFAAAKRHVAIYGMPVAAFAAELRGYGMSKGAVRFPLDQPVPAELVRKLVLARAGA